MFLRNEERKKMVEFQTKRIDGILCSLGGRARHRQLFPRGSGQIREQRTTVDDGDETSGEEGEFEQPRISMRVFHL